MTGIVKGKLDEEVPEIIISNNNISKRLSMFYKLCFDVEFTSSEKGKNKKSERG